jgi:hypothetical protein
MGFVDLFFTRDIPDTPELKTVPHNVSGLHDSINGRPLVRGAYKYVTSERVWHFNPDTVDRLARKHKLKHTADPSVLFFLPGSGHPVRPHTLVRMAGRQSETPDVLGAMYSR